jgi:hypothetical protein
MKTVTLKRQLMNAGNYGRQYFAGDLGSRYELSIPEEDWDELGSPEIITVIIRKKRRELDNTNL